FMAQADAWFVKQALESGFNLRILICSPDIDGALKEVLNNHDERNRIGQPPVHDHVSGAKSTLETLRSISQPVTKGRLQIRARSDIPNPTMAMVDPTTRHGKIRVELKLYKKNHGEVPYFIMTRSSVWYDMFFEHYYVRLWNDSSVLYDSNSKELTAHRVDASQQTYVGKTNDSNA
ncbi:MAG: hypothetical protein WAM70_03915, partial [Pyrinomonadaceae bacterium]